MKKIINFIFRILIYPILLISFIGDKMDDLGDKIDKVDNEN